MSDYTHLADEDLHHAFTDPATTAPQRQEILNEISARAEQRLSRGVSPAPSVSRVVITGLDIPFRDLVNFLVTLALASIPAMIVLVAISFCVWVFLAGLINNLRR